MYGLWSFSIVVLVTTLRSCCSLSNHVFGAVLPVIILIQYMMISMSKSALEQVRPQKGTCTNVFAGTHLDRSRKKQMEVRGFAMLPSGGGSAAVLHIIVSACAALFGLLLPPSGEGPPYHNWLMPLEVAADSVVLAAPWPDSEVYTSSTTDYLFARNCCCSQHTPTRFSSGCVVSGWGRNYI